MTRDDVVAEVRTWAGVPFVHQAHVRAGCDCAGLIRGVMIALGLMPADVSQWPGVAQFDGYSRQPNGASFIAACRAYLTEIDPADAQAGDAVAMRFRRDPQHIGILVPYPHGGMAIVHALSSVGRVAEHRLDDRWRRLVTHAFRMPGVV